MLKLWLARHSEAVDPDGATTDFDRRLTETGRRRFGELITWMMQREEAPELILHSPLVRARQTAEIAAELIGSDMVTLRVENRLAPGIDTDELLRHLADTMAERILCVGHQPDMSHCLAEMLGGGHIQYFPGTIACVEFPGPIIRSGAALRWLAAPQWFD